MKNILIVYYSWSGNTKKIAEQIQKIVGGDLFEIVPQDAYPKNYNACVDQAKKEIAVGAKPILKSKPENIEAYDTIILGSPVWWYTVAPPVSTFLHENDLSGKPIAFFCTHGGGGISNCVKDVTKMCPKSRILEAIAFYGNKTGASQKELPDWLHRIKGGVPPIAETPPLNSK